MLNRAAAVAFILSAVLLLAGCRRDEPPVKHEGRGPCPKIEGSYFGAERSEIRKGEAIRLRYKVPGVYAAAVHVEGLEVAPPTISSFKAGPSAGPLATATPLPEWYEGEFTDVRPEKSTRFVLKAAGPEGCQPLELPATVTVVE